MGKHTSPDGLVDPYRTDHHAALLNKARDKFHDDDGSLIVVVDDKLIIARVVDLAHGKKIAAECRKYHLATTGRAMKVKVYASSPTAIA